MLAVENPEIKGMKSNDLSTTRVCAFAQEIALTTPKHQSKKKQQVSSDEPSRRHCAVGDWLLLHKILSILRGYQGRWQIECMFRETKQHFALGACMPREFDAASST